jgi:5-methylcytosine-specific restriction endonuclease McrA
VTVDETTPNQPRGLCLHLMGCSGCGQALPKGRRRWCSDACRTAWYIDHLWAFARDECMRRAERRCIGCGERATEVDHIVERKGAPMHKPTCLHHQSNLRALCHTCHVNRRTVFQEAQR